MITQCPQCAGDVERGYVNAPGVGIVWTSEAGKFWLFGKGTARLQEDWMGFPKFRKDGLAAVLCPTCKLVVFEYTGDSDVPPKSG